MGLRVLGGSPRCGNHFKAGFGLRVLSGSPRFGLYLGFPQIGAGTFLLVPIIRITASWGHTGYPVLANAAAFMGA